MKPKVIHDGDIFRSRAQTLVNTVNCVGVMGKGIALGFRRRFPAMYDDYIARCERKEVQLGRPYLYRDPASRWILNFPTKDHWRSLSRLVDIEAGLDYLVDHYRDWGITSLAMPPLGAGHGGLEWHIVGPTLYQHLTRMQIPVELYVPYGTRHEELQPAFLQESLTGPEPPDIAVGRIGPAWVALLEALARLERQTYRPIVGRTLFQKLTYFGTAAGLDLGLEYSRGSYGPFSPDVKRAVSHLMNNGLIVEVRKGSLFEVRLGATFEAAARAMGPELEAHEDQIDRLVDLFARMHTPDAELAATIHFVWNELSSGGAGPPTERAVVDAVIDWKRQRQPTFSREQIEEATRSLNLLGWIEATPTEDLESDPDFRLLAT